MISVHLDVIESKNTQLAVGVTQPESFDEEKFENSPEPEFPVIAFDQIDEDMDDDTTVSSVKVEICDEEPDTFEAMEMDSEEIEINSTDWENEEAKYENGHFTCLWEIDRNGTTPGHICGTTFNRRSDFVDHSKHHLNHSDRVRSMCNWRGCSRYNRGFGAGYKLVNHYRVHTGEKPFLCVYGKCRKRFARVENMRIHMRIHTGEKPFPCKFPGCSKRFTNSSDRKKHAHTHNIGTFHCPVDGCQKVYRHPSSYRKHVNSEHFERRHELTLEATRAFYPDKNNKGDPSKTYARIFGKDGFMEVESPHSSPETPLKIEPEETNPSIPNISLTSQSLNSNTSIMDVKFDAEKEELRQKLIIEYEARLNIFKQFKVIEAGKRLNATPFKCQACSHSFATKELLVDHYATAHSRPEYRCIKCNLTSSSLEHFSIHSAQCTEIPDIDICDFCPYIFDASKPFDKFNHIKSHLMNSDAVDNSATVLNASGINTYG